MILEVASRLDGAEFVALADAVAETTREHPQTDSVELIRAYRDRAWR